MKIAFVVQRYGLEINGGAELHCRWIAEHMQNHWDVEVLTTTAFDYISWKNHYPVGDELVNGIRVRRFPVIKPRDPVRFGKLQDLIVYNEHRLSDEHQWLEEEGPRSPALIEYIQAHKNQYDFYVFFSYRYYHSYWGIGAVPDKSVLVPTAEHDPVIHLRLFKDLFRKPRAFVYNSIEEKDMIQKLSQNQHIPSSVVGVGTEVPGSYFVDEFRQKYEITGNYLIYVGRIDENKGCDELFDFFLRYKQETHSDIKLVLVGSSVLKIPYHPDLIYLGFLSEEEKFSALKGALILCMPSFFESLSMVTLEAWALQKPVLANARCEVLKGQCQRSQAGLYYIRYEDFREALSLMLEDGLLRAKMGENGLTYFRRHYSWEIIVQKYLDLLNRLLEESG